MASHSEQDPDYLLQLARLFQTLANEQAFEDVIPARAKNPPASKHFVASLHTISKEENEACSICLAKYESKELIKELPKCKYYFHADCILPWLHNTNTCPMCRHEYPTDDFEYEEKRRLKEKENEREEMLEDLHNSMFS